MLMAFVGVDRLLLYTRIEARMTHKGIALRSRSTRSDDLIHGSWIQVVESERNDAQIYGCR